MRDQSRAEKKKAEEEAARQDSAIKFLEQCVFPAYNATVEKTGSLIFPKQDTLRLGDLLDPLLEEFRDRNHPPKNFGIINIELALSSTIDEVEGDRSFSLVRPANPGNLGVRDLGEIQEALRTWDGEHARADEGRSGQYGLYLQSDLKSLLEKANDLRKEINGNKEKGKRDLDVRAGRRSQIIPKGMSVEEYIKGLQ